MNRGKEEPSTMAVADGSAGRNSFEVNISPQRKKSMTEEEKREKRNERARRWRQENPECEKFPMVSEFFYIAGKKSKKNENHH